MKNKGNSVFNDFGKEMWKKMRENKVLTGKILLGVLLAAGLGVCAYSTIGSEQAVTLWVLYLLVFIAGFVDAIAGGGGLISLSAYYAVGLPPHLALGTNKFSSSCGTVVATARFMRTGYIHWESAIYAVTGALIGSSLGAKLALMLDEKYLKYVMMVLVPLVAIFVLFKKDFGVSTKKLSQKRMIVYSVLAGLIIGMYDGFFGPGTGTFLTIIFTTIIGFDMVTACGNTKIVNLASNLAALATFVFNGNVNYQIGVPCALCGIAGCYIGAGLAIQKGAKIVRPVMLVVVVLLLVKIGGDLIL